MSTVPKWSLLIPLLATLSGCAAAAPAAAPRTSEDGWSRLATPRIRPLAGAPRIAVGEINLTSAGWGAATPVPPSLAVQELVAAGLLRRADVHFVERRRFAAAAERERRGLPAPPGAPPLGTTPGAELVLMGSSLALGDSAYLDLRLVDPETGETRAAWRIAAAGTADPPSLARLVTGSLLANLARLERLPRWEDPVAGAAPMRFTASGVPEAGWRAFLAGVSAEDRYDWNAARAAYERALRAAGSAFFEAEAALARAARLRAGGTLGAS